MLQRLCKLVKQPRITNGNDCLIGKGAYQFDLPVRKGPHDGAHQANDAHRGTLLLQRNPKHCAIFSGSLIFKRCVFGVGQAVRQMNGLLLKCDAADERSAPGRQRMLRCVFHERSRGVVGGGQMVFAVLELVDQREFCVAQATSGSHDGIENWLKLHCGAVDCIEDIAGGLLPLQSLGQLTLQQCQVGSQRRTFARDRRFSAPWSAAHRFSALRH